MIITPKEVRLQILNMRKAGTDKQLVEAKEATEKLPATITDTISAFSNGSGGLILLGLSEQNGFKPVENFNIKKVSDAFADACANKMEPPVRPETDVIEFEGKEILAAWIPGLPPRDKPCYAKAQGMYKGSFIRVSDGDHHLSIYEVDRLLENKSQPTYDIEMVEGATQGDLDRELVAGMLEHQRKEHPRVFADLPDEKILFDLRILARDPQGVARPTIAGLVALGRYPQHFFPNLSVSFAIYSVISGHEELVKARNIVGSVPAMLEDAIAAVAAAESGSEYPSAAVREALVNALMHRDYSPLARAAQVQVNLHDDRLEVLTPGGLYGSVAVDVLGEIGYVASRNQFLANILEGTPFGDGFVSASRGTGYQIIESELARTGMQPPRAQDTLSMFKLTICRRTESSAVELDSNPIVGFLERAGEASATEIAEATGIKRSTLNYQLKRLVEKGAIERIGAPKSPKQAYRISKG